MYILLLLYSGLLLRVCTVSDSAAIRCMHFISSNLIQSYGDDEDLPSYLSSPVAVANLVVGCDDGSFSVVQCGVAYSPPMKPLVDGWVDWPTVACLTEWLTDWLTEWMNEWMNEWMSD